MKMQLFFMAGIIAVSLGVSSCSDNDDEIIDNPYLTEHDKSFMLQATYGNWSEVDMGKLADSVSTDSSVRMFGRKMQADHSDAQNNLNSIAGSWNIDLPDTPDSAHIALRQQLQQKNGKSFDTAYISGQIKDHAKTIALFEDAAANSSQVALKNYAAKYLPAIKMHKAMADTMALRLMRP
ncbi:putative membrane protein [Chitinophaga terrae (ex Kim and Jung 2007)]|uniref:Putative membrane protein n=1 Tax=Chitinophaga terrae (ex Kim and Jung 2007) TaxID=408074 RepID=A0A1H4AW18_9BACT|nr:DUF4142 domain-containing protein [Chitinophaga terrae (ex Kim and Jung 2007)]GEP89110.1 hypothetical protein CTE07_07550 [Chitinophaga terrae (ex Kim and Jung 2007)]SEA40079.1 putative membrane protein [Chitinophaga terrae (ex Kim and Jung 2007)]